ncbi:hypothetical protein PRZ48_010004 [Zasmidium cellare]|uniref:F-box domain-containing protein n=1 Tax=Zasmidium cellare TaxID=395010 RepID=A0ABR0EDB1_ZASCE|nr:hypothetical protein PRZ48_010004 [Zasmidium cellare]
MVGTKTKLDIGGDYDQWWKGMQPALGELWARGLLVYCKPPRDSRIPRYVEGTMEEGNVEASMVILSRVSTSLLLRVPIEDRFQPRKLLAHLITFSKPFRILDLPFEIRLRIYEMYLDAAPCSTEVLNECYGRTTTCVLPHLTKTCRQIRQESLKLFISSKTLNIELPDSTDESQALRNMDTIRRWAEKCARAYLRHVRHLNLWTFHHYKGFRCSLSFTDHEGLKISLENDRPRDYDDAKAEAKRKQLQEHAEKIEAERRALDLKGESIILAMIRDTQVWFWEIDEEDR